MNDAEPYCYAELPLPDSYPVRLASFPKVETCVDAGNGCSNLVVTLGLMQLARKIPFENEEVLFGLRGAYILSQIIQFGIYYFINMQVRPKTLRCYCRAMV